MTTALRGTSSLTVAPTQNTAPVFEFRCLYTHDLRKKKKIWHDGSLRFHTFNRRVMVYDDAKNYIGDAHWRETGEFQEGEELKLDKGVLVEVGEQIGHTETDLAPIILEKRRPENPCSPSRVPPSNAYSSTLRTAGTASQARPKSLAAVLGASQGPIGRARVVARSPFEQRQDNVRQQPESSGERPAKKPRMATEKENVVYNFNSVRQIPSSAPRTTARSEARRGRVSPGRQKPAFSEKSLEASANLLPRPPANPTQLASREEARSQNEIPPVEENIRPSYLKMGTSTRKSVRKVVERCSSPISAPRQTSKQRSPEHRLAARTRETIHGEASARDSAENARASAGKLTNRLRFATEKPRRKLMYKNLHPHGVREGISRTREKRGDPQKQEREKMKFTLNELKNSERSQPPDALIFDLVSEGEGDSTRGAQTPIRGREARIARESPSSSTHFGVNSRSSSPLFVGLSPDLQSLPASQKSVGEDFEPPAQSMSPNQGITESEGPELLKDPRGLSSINDNEAGGTLATNGLVTKPVALAHPPSTLTLFDQRLLRTSAEMQLPPEQTHPQISPNQRPFSRILSETDAHPQRREVFGSRLSPRAAAMATAGRAQRIPNRPQQPFKSPSKMQRSVSDTSHLLRRTAVLVRDANVDAAVEAGFDPWSAPEAYLLFDWWPPGKEKPSFVVNE
jgi:Protein of unknown function (DUF2439)